MSDNLLVDDDGGVRLITFNRPEKLNAFDNALYNAVGDALLEARERDDIKCVVLTGAGRAFSLTLKELSDWRGNRADAGRLAPKGFPRSNKFR